MVFAQFFQRSVLSRDLIEATGDRGVIILDGRERRSSWERIAARECLKRGYLAFQLCKGEAFTRAASISDITLVFKDTQAAHEACMDGRHPFVTVENYEGSET